MTTMTDKINGLGTNNTIHLRWVSAHKMIHDLCVTCNKLFGKELLYKIFMRLRQFVWVLKCEMGDTCQGEALVPLGYPKALWRKTVKAAIGEAQPVP